MSNEYGKILINQGSELISKDPAGAIKLIQKGLMILPTASIGWFNLGIALHKNRNISAAIAAYEQAIACNNPMLTEAINNLAQDLLLAGDFKKGWNLYEIRLQKMADNHRIYNRLFGPMWKGKDEKRSFKELIIIAEQGLGDTLQFCRFIPELERRGIKATLFCDHSLAALLRESTTVGKVVTSLTKVNASTLWCPLMSIPNRLELTNKTIPFAEGYLRPDKKRITKWRGLIKRSPYKKLVALHWQGNPKFEKSLYSRGRSIPFKVMEKLSTINDIEFVSIQKGTGSEQIKSVSKISFVSGQEEFDKTYDFRDTAAVLSICDCLISADSSVVHLSGAMGIPTWIALSWVPEWRWGLEGSKSPWYESVRLFRQPENGDWENVIETMSLAIKDNFNKK